MSDPLDWNAKTIAEFRANEGRVGGNFNLRMRAAVCPGCQAAHDLEHSVIDRQYRFEGDSDPGDEAIVLTLRCPACGT